MTLLVAELDKQCFTVEFFNDGADLAARKPLRRKIAQQSHYV
jgi:hypothetical protein